MLALIIIALLASIAFRRTAQAKGCAANRIQFYPVLILAVVIVPAFWAELFLAYAVSHQFCSQMTSKAAMTVISILCFLFYIGALSRTYIRLKMLPSLPSAPPPPPHPQKNTP